jgi:hypothetical protein
VGPLAVQLGAKVAAPALERSAKTTNFAVARLVEAAKNGSTAAQLGKKAIELGLPASVGIGLANAYTGRRKTSELDELEEGTEAL